MDLVPTQPAAARAVQPATVHPCNGEEFHVPQGTIDAVETLRVPDGVQQADTGEQSYMYFLGNFFRPPDRKEKT